LKEFQTIANKKTPEVFVQHWQKAQNNPPGFDTKLYTDKVIIYLLKVKKGKKKPRGILRFN